MTSSGNSDVFILSLSNNCSFNWAKQFGNGSIETPRNMTINASNNIFITGDYQGTTNFNNGNQSNNHSSSGQSDIFILKTDSQGNFIWSKSIGGMGIDSGDLIESDQFNNLVILGSFQFGVDFNTNPGTTNQLGAGSGTNAVFFLKVDSLGDYISASAIKGSNSSHQITAMGLNVQPNGKICISGIHQGTTDFDPNSGISTYRSSGFGDGYIAEYNGLSNGILSSNLNTVIDIWPNPASEKIFIKNTIGLISVRLIDNLGKLVYTGTEPEINISNLPHGQYFLIIKTNEGEHSSIVIKE